MYSSGLCTFKDRYFTIILSTNHQGILLKFCYDKAVQAWNLWTSISGKSPGTIYAVVFLKRFRTGCVHPYILIKSTKLYNIHGGKYKIQAFVFLIGYIRVIEG